MDTSLFYDYEHRPSRIVPDEVREVCRGCPVKTSCLENALTFPELYGFHAGTTAGDRRRMRKRLGLSNKKKKKRQTVI